MLLYDRHGSYSSGGSLFSSEEGGLTINSTKTECMIASRDRGSRLDKYRQFPYVLHLITGLTLVVDDVFVCLPGKIRNINFISVMKQLDSC